MNEACKCNELNWAKMPNVSLTSSEEIHAEEIHPVKTKRAFTTESSTREKTHSHLELFLKENLQNEMTAGFLKIAYSPRLILKLFWALSLTITLGLTAYLVIESVLAYLSFNVATTARTVSETPTLFPKVTVCNYNPFQTEYSVHFISEINQSVAPNSDIFNQTQMSMLNFTEKSDLFTIIYTAATSKMLSTHFSDEQRKKLGHSLEDILMTCSFNGESCSASDFIWKFDKYFGNCYVFNSGFNSSGHRVELKQSYIAGSSFGLKIGFYTGFYENLTLFTALGSKGAYVRIENSSYLSDETLDNGVYVAPGKWANVLLNREFKFMLAKPYSNCDLDNDSPDKHTGYELVDLMARSLYQYTQQACLFLCMQKQMIQKCNCTFPEYISLYDAEQCATNDQLDCYNQILANFFTSDYIQKTCLPACPLECNRTKYEYAVTEIDLMGELTVDFLKENSNLARDFVTVPINAVSAKDSVSQISIFYYSLTYTLTTETPQMDIVALLASIGGNLGLFMGVSVLSFCELIDVLIEICFFKLFTLNNFRTCF